MITQLLIAASVPAAAQRLTATATEIDCGKVAYEKPVTATFELRNKGVRKLKITDVKTSCGCIGVDYPKEEIPAGEKFMLRLTYDARQLGTFSKSACIVSNGSKKPVYLTMTGVVMADLKDYSGSYPFAVGDLLIDRNELEFDDVNKGDNPVQEIYMMNAGTKVFTPNMMHLPPYLSAVVTPERLAPGRSGKVTVMLNSSKLRDFGLTQTSVYIARNPGEKVSGDNEIAVSAVLLPAFDGQSGGSGQHAPQMSLSADSLRLVLDGKQKKSGEIVITNNGRSTLKITSLQMFTSDLKVTLGKRDIEPGQSTKLKITARLDDNRKQRSKPRVLMITNDPERPKVVVKVDIVK